MPSDPLFGPMFATAEMSAAVSAGAWVRAMLEVECALARAQAAAGFIPSAAADAIADACNRYEPDLDALGRGTAETAVPVLPLVADIRRLLPPGAAGDFHRGATSQDIVDTAGMLVTRQALTLLVRDLDRAAAAAALLADRHRLAPMAGRTLMQQAVPTSFGLKAAGWLMGLVDAMDGLVRFRDRRLALQLGGAAGTLAAMGRRGSAVEREMAALLGLHVAPLPWHTARQRTAELASLLAIAAGTAGKIAQDVLLLSQSEVGEVREGAAPGRGSSSAMPHKRNPVGAVTVTACVRRLHGLVPILLASMVQEHERAAGAWQAEWPTLNEAFELCAGALSGAARLLETLEVDEQAMRRNLEAGGGLAFSEQALTLLAGRLGPGSARATVDGALRRARERGTVFRDELASDSAVAAALSTDEIAALFDPAHALGSAEDFIDRALAAHRSAGEGRTGW